MATDPTMAAYVRLRELDELLYGYERALHALAQTTKRETEAAAAAEAHVKEVEESIKAIRVQERAMELQIRTIDQELLKYDAALRTSSSASVMAMTEKAVAAKRLEREAAENAGLELLDRLDTLTNKLKEAQSAAKGRDTALQASVAASAHDEPIIRGKISEGETQIRTLLESLPDGFGQRYWESSSSPGRPVFAKVKESACSSCGSDLPASILSKAGHGAPESCPGCHRLLLNV